MTTKTLNETLTVAESRIAAASRAAFRTFFNSLPDTPHPGLENHRRARTSELFEVVVMPIDKFRHAYDHIKPVDIQRDHLRRIERGECEYLTELHLSHVQYMWVVDPETHEIGFGDGNSRSALYFVKDAAELIPDHVVVLVYYPLNKEMARDVYHCVDSAANHKRTRHDITSMYRACEIDVDSLHDGLVGDGFLTSALRRLVKVHSMKPIGGAKGRDSLEKLIRMYKAPLEWLDSYELGAKTLNQGIVGAALWLRHQNLGADDKLDNYLNEIIRISTGGNRKGISDVVKEFWADVSEYGLGTERSVDYVFGKCYLKFKPYLSEGSKKSTAAERKRVQKAADSMSALPRILEKKLAA